MILDPGRLLHRVVDEAHAAAVFTQAGAVRVQLPHRYLKVLRGFYAYGSIGALVELGATMRPEQAAVIDERGTLSFGELDRRSSALANGWRAAGLRAGDGVGILARNHRGLIEALAAAAKVGARTLLLHTDFAGPQLRDVCAREDVALLVHDEEFAAAGQVEVPLGRLLAWVDGSSAASIDSVIAGSSDATPPKPDQGQRLVLLTSGTTGTPKGAPRDLGMSLVAPGGFLSKVPLRSGRTVFVAAPAFHAWGLLTAMMTMAVGGTVVLRRRFDAAATLDAVADHGCDGLSMVPVMLSRLLALGEESIAARDLSALRIICVSGSAVSADLATRTRVMFGDVLYNIYGSTEVSFAAIATPADLRAAPGCVGRPPFGTTVRLYDEDGREVPRGRQGRIFVGSGLQFSGYTGGGGKQIVDGLMSTGDVGHLDDAGRLFLDGRADDMIVSGGENVFPSEVEDLLAAHEDVAEVAVVGVEDEKFGQRLRAFVVLRPGARADEDALREHVRANLARYKVPRDVLLVTQLPRTITGKIRKNDLA